MTWTREKVRSELLKLLAQHAQSDTPITEAMGLVADLGLDSLGVMEIVADMEDTFALPPIPDDTLREVETVADVIKAIEGRLAAEGRLEG